MPSLAVRMCCKPMLPESPGPNFDTRVWGLDTSLLPQPIDSWAEGRDLDLMANGAPHQNGAPTRNKALIFGLIKGKQWLISPLQEFIDYYWVLLITRRSIIDYYWLCGLLTALETFGFPHLNYPNPSQAGVFFRLEGVAKVCWEGLAMEGVITVSKTFNWEKTEEFWNTPAGNLWECRFEACFSRTGMLSDGLNGALMRVWSLRLSPLQQMDSGWGMVGEMASHGCELDYQRRRVRKFWEDQVDC